MRLSRQVGNYIEGLVVGQGRHAGQPLRLLGWQKRFLAGAFGNEGDAALSMARGNGKTTFTAAIACSAVDVGGPLVEPMGECLLVASSFDQGLIAFRHHLPLSQANPGALRAAVPGAGFGKPSHNSGQENRRAAAGAGFRSAPVAWLRAQAVAAG